MIVGAASRLGLYRPRHLCRLVGEHVALLEAMQNPLDNPTASQGVDAGIRRLGNLGRDETWKCSPEQQSNHQMHMDSRLIGSASTGTFPGPAGNGRSALDPLVQSFSVFQDLLRDAVVLHHLALGSGRPERFHASAFEFRTSAVVYLEIERVIVNEREEQIAAVNPNPTEH